MNENREKMIDRMIAIYGYEHPIVLQFAEMCEGEVLTDKQLGVLVYLHEKFPQYNG